MDAGTALARELMLQFADRTGITGTRAPRRYLWTDAFAVCNFLGLHAASDEGSWLDLALRLVDQVHHVLGRHRADDPRQGWISGLDDGQGELHPTIGGLRIGKPLPERSPQEHLDQRLEWERDGQYFHYLTRWMHSLHRVALATGELRYARWARELAASAHAAFGHAGGDVPGRLVWKMSIDLTRPLVGAMGHHDALDAVVGCLELQGSPAPADAPSLEQEIAAAAAMCAGASWATDDPLGLGGLLVDAALLAPLVDAGETAHRPLLDAMIDDADRSLRAFWENGLLGLAPAQRLAFRELGLSIGLHAIELVVPTLADEQLQARLAPLRRHAPLAERIERSWSDPEARSNRIWSEHEDIDAVMLATSLAPEGYVGVLEPPS